jgi:hypothetical protein
VLKVREEKNCAGKESDLLFTNKTVSESLSSDSNLESHGYNSENDPEYRPKNLSEETEHDKSDNSNLGAEEEAVNEPGNATVKVEASVDEISEGLPQKRKIQMEEIKHCTMET